MEKIGEEKKEQSFLDHLEVLRWHLIRSSSACKEIHTGIEQGFVKWSGEFTTI